MATGTTTSGANRAAVAVAELRNGESKTPEESIKGPSTQRSPGSGWFPLPYREGLSQWWANMAPAAAEQRVLGFMPFIGKAGRVHADGDTAADEVAATTAEEDPHGPRRWRSRMVSLAQREGSKGGLLPKSLNEFSVERVGEPVRNELVMLHGYGAGLGFYYGSFEPLSRVPGWRITALDLPGMGRSSRSPAFPRPKAKDQEGRIAETEDWFVDALEQWRKARGLDSFTLLGHSLGGYLATAYALKYPGHLKKLILASPVGVPDYGLTAEPEREGINQPPSTIHAEFTQSSEDTTAPGSEREGSIGTSTSTVPRRKIPKWINVLWDANVSPFNLVRWTGPLGPRLVSGWTSRRFAHLPSEHADALHDYSYSLFRQPGSGEYALAHLLAPGAYARSPLIRRMAKLGRGELPPSVASEPDLIHSEASSPATSTAVTPMSSVVDAPAGHANPHPQRERGIPVVFLYGEHDWMDVSGGYASQKILRDTKARAVAAAREAGDATPDNGDSKVIVIPRAGHNLFLDGPDHFNRIMRDEMKDVERRDGA